MHEAKTTNQNHGRLPKEVTRGSCPQMSTAPDLMTCASGSTVRKPGQRSWLQVRWFRINGCHGCHMMPLSSKRSSEADSATRYNLYRWHL